MRKFGLIVSLLSVIFVSPLASAEGPKLGASEIAFAQDMAPHHQQAILLANLALKNSRNKEIRVIAFKIRAEQTPEILLMQSWLRSAGSKLGPTSTMNGMDMGTNGMLSSRQLTTLRAARNGAFDKLFLLAMIGHHKGAIQMSGQIADSKYPAAITLRKNIVSSQSAEISQMRKILATLGR